MEEKDQTVNTAPQSQEPSQIEDSEKTQQKEGETSPSAAPKVHRTVPMIPHDRKVTFRKKQPQEDSKLPDPQKQAKAGKKYVKKDELQEQAEDEKKAYVEMKPHDKKFSYQKKGAKVEREPPKMEKQSKSEKQQNREHNERPVSLSRSIMRQSSFDFSQRPRVEEKKKKEEAESPQDKKAKPKYVKKAAVPMNFEELEEYFASQPKQRASSFSSNHAEMKTSTLFRLPPGLHQAKSTPFNFEQPVGGMSRPLVLPSNPPTFKPGPVKLKVEAHSFTPSEGIDLASLVTKAPSFTPQS